MAKNGLQAAMMNATANWRRTLRVLGRFCYLLFFLILGSIFSLIPFKIPFISKMIRNKNVYARHCNIPEPQRFNSWADFRALHQLFSLFWVNDLASHLNTSSGFKKNYQQFQYDTIVRTFFPTKNSPYESINMARTWQNSYWNRNNTYKSNNIQIYRKSDILFADMMTNTQGIYKVKKINRGELQYEKAKLFFEDLLEDYRKIFEPGCQEDKTVLEYLIDNQNLYYLDYPQLRNVEKKRDRNERYYNRMTTINGNNLDAYFEIPFAIFSDVKGFVREDQNDFLCLASVFNETFYKTEKDSISKDQIYHGLSDDPLQRDRWEMAKCHMASTDTNDFTFRIHLGWLHYASSIYTTAFCNLAQDKNMPWLKTQFIDVFSHGLLQIDFLANLTLIDHKQPMAQKIFYMTREQTVDMIIQSNRRFNIMEFNPLHLGKTSYQSDSIIMSTGYYQKIRIYIQYLLMEHRNDWAGNTRQINAYLYDQLGTQSNRFDGIPQSIVGDETQKSLETIMTNLAYLWVVHHGQTFSLISVASNFYLVPPMMRRPLSQVGKRSTPLADAQKQDYLCSTDIIKDSMTLHKVVTYRSDAQCIISRWSDLVVSNQSWKKFMEKIHGKESNEAQAHFLDFWNDVSLKHEKLNYQRTAKGLYNLHWLMPNELPISLNI